MARTKTQTSPNQPAIALEGTLTQWDSWLAAQPAMARDLNRAAKNAEMFWTEQQIGSSLPATLQLLLMWHDGARPSSRLFDALTREVLPALFDVASGGLECPRGIRFLNHRAIALFGATSASLQNEEARARGPLAKLVPFLWLRESSDEDAPDDEPSNGDRVLAIDNQLQAVWLFTVSGREAMNLRLQAPSLSNLLDRYLAVLVSGKINAQLRDAGGPPR